MKKILKLLSFALIGFTTQGFSQVLLNESFDDTSFVPAGWYKAKINFTNFPNRGQWQRITEGTNPVVTPHSGAGIASFDSRSSDNGTISELGTPALDLSTGVSYRLRYWIYRGDNASQGTDLLEVYINTQQNITNAYKLGGQFISRLKTPAEAING